MVWGSNVVFIGVRNIAVVVASVQDPSHQPENVYFVHPLNNPSSVLVTLVSNYSSHYVWERSM